MLTKRRENLMDRIADLPSEVSADLFYGKIREITKKLESADDLKSELGSQKTKTQSTSIDQSALKTRLERTLKLLDVAPNGNQRAIFSNDIQFAEIHPMKVRLGLYAPTGP